MATDWATKLYGSGGQPETQPMSPAFQRGQQNSQTSQSKFPQLNTILQMGGGIAGGITGGGLGGLLGLETGPGALATGYAGGVAGAGAGAAGGNALADFLRSKVLGDQTVNTSQTLPNSVQAGEAGAIGQAIGGPLAKGLGFLAHPIKPFIDMVDKTLASSAKTVNIGEINGLLSKFESQIIPKLTQDGYGPEAQSTYDKLQSRIVGMTQSRLGHVPASAGIQQDINSLTVPIAAANGIKRDLYTLAKNTYSGIRKATDVMSPLEQTGAADFAKLLKTNIGQQEPGVNLPNAIASKLYKVPETLSGLTSILPNQGGAAVRAIGNLPFEALQKIIPSGGGYLNQAIPRGLQFLFGVNANNQEQQ